MYTTYVKSTYDEYKKMIKATTKSKYLKLILTMGCISFILFSMIIGFKLITFIMSLFLTAIFFLETFIIRTIRTKLTWKSNRMSHNLVCQLTFNEHDLKIENKFGITRIPYHYLYKIIETETNFYILASKTTCYNVIKNNCSIDLINFLKNLKLSVNTNVY